MSEVSIAEAKNTLARLSHEAENGAAIQINRRGKTVAVLISEYEYEKLKTGKSKKDFWQAIQQMRPDPNFQPVNLGDDEIDSWHSKSTGREFS
jgi:prevent-host-death family protein